MKKIFLSTALIMAIGFAFSQSIDNVVKFDRETIYIEKFKQNTFPNGPNAPGTKSLNL